MNTDYIHGQTSEYDHRTTGRWSREEHEKFIEGIKIQKDINIFRRFSKSIPILYLNVYLNIYFYSNEYIWKRLEES